VTDAVGGLVVIVEQLKSDGRGRMFVGSKRMDLANAAVYHVLIPIR
jgi:hypothetical protein